MRIAVVAISEKRSEKLKRIATSVLREFGAMGHSAELFENVDSHLSIYDFLVVCSEPRGFGKSLGPRLGEQLSNSGNLVGRRSMALLVKSGFFPRKSLNILMGMMEKEGLVVTMGELVVSEAESIAAARGAPIIRG